MIIGETLWSNYNTARDYYTPWFPRLGNNAKFIFEVIQLLDVTVSVTVQTKNSEDNDGSIVAATSQSLSGGLTEWQPSWNGCLELVRFKISVTGTNLDAPGLVHLRPLTPSWITN